MARGAARARVDAVVALVRAREKAAVDAEAARALLAPHLGALERVPEARKLVREAEARLAERRVAKARGEVEAALAALAAGRAEEALEQVGEAVLRDLPDGERPAAEALRGEAAHVVAIARRVAEVARLRAAGNLFAARELADELAAESEGEARARWEEERRALQEEIQAAFHVEVDEEPGQLDGGLAPFPRLMFWHTAPWLTADGLHLVLAEGIGPRVVINVVERAGQVVQAAVLLRAPEPFEQLWVEVIGRTLWLVSTTGAALALAMDGWQVLTFRAAPEHASRSSLQRVPVLPSGREGPRFLWTPAGEHVGVFDLATRRPARALPGVTSAMALRGMAEARVASLVADTVVLYEDRGAPVPGGRGEGLGGKALGVVVRPDGEGLVVLVEISRAEHRELGWVDVPFHGAPRAPQIIAGAQVGGRGRIHCGREAGVVLITLWDLQGARESSRSEWFRGRSRRRGSVSSGACPTLPRGW